MEAVSKMMFHGDLPPVGNTISLQAASENILESLLPDHKYWVDSGTSALALALLDAKASFPQIIKPRAIIPGYCCPDLVAACVYAGIEPIAIDIAVDDPAYDLGQLRDYLKEDVVAVIAINFLGIAERLDELRELISGLGLQTRLIEDNAQWFPSSAEEMRFASDYVTFSFGRGKPLSLLGGGLLIARQPLANTVLQKIAPPVSKPAVLRVKVRAYNLLLAPLLYMFLNRNPFMRLGETKYTALEKIEQLDSFRYSLLTANFNLYSQRKSELQKKYKDVVASDVQKLDVLLSDRCGRLLRYPLLCPNATTRMMLLERMRVAGLGATPMYDVAIDQIAGVGSLVTVPAPLINASAFADRFMSLPVGADIAPVFQQKILSFVSQR